MCQRKKSYLIMFLHNFFIFNIYIRNAGKTRCIKHELRDCKVSSIQWLFTVKVESQIFGFLKFYNGNDFANI